MGFSKKKSLVLRVGDHARPALRIQELFIPLAWSIGQFELINLQTMIQCREFKENGSEVTILQVISVIADFIPIRTGFHSDKIMIPQQLQSSHLHLTSRMFCTLNYY